MSPRMLFVIMLLIGVILAYLGSKTSDKTKVILIILGGIVTLIAVFGIFTSLI